MTVITDEMRALIGVESEPRTAALPLSEEMLRRFVHGVMEPDPVHWDPEAAAASKYGEVVATPLFPMHSMRRPPGGPDPFDDFRENPDGDGTQAGRQNGLPPLNLPFKRVLNGGTEAEFFRLARIGDVITVRSKYVDLTERESRSGNPMVIVRVRTTYTNQDDEVLTVTTSSVIYR
ncbi:MaoC family dehydratase N-terminal domain-containing protein [Streptomyces mutabilis]|uniref:FAS1-like dehydratase domain-containing protein n=1 Tax=Streptomyces mutabilis TaxID=67332 RepID=UPI0036586898